MWLTRLFLGLCMLNIRSFPVFMFFFSLAKQAMHVLYEGRISVGTFRFTLAYFALIWDRQLTIDKFVMTFIGIGVIY